MNSRRLVSPPSLRAGRYRGWAGVRWLPCLVSVLVAGTPLGAEPPSPLEPEGPPTASKSIRIVSVSGAFALTFPGPEWYAVNPEIHPEFEGLDLAVFHKSGGAWLKGRLARRSNRGVEGALIDEARQAKYLIQYDPDSVKMELSEADYRGSAVYCGRRRQGTARKACSRVGVALHGRQMVQLHSLVDAPTPRLRERLLAEIDSAFASLELLSGPAAN